MKAVEHKQERGPFYDLAFFPFTMRISRKTHMFILFLAYLIILLMFVTKFDAAIGEYVALYTLCFFAFIPLYKLILILVDITVIKKFCELCNADCPIDKSPTDDRMVNLLYYGKLPESFRLKNLRIVIDHSSVQQDVVHQTPMLKDSVPDTSTSLNNVIPVQEEELEEYCNERANEKDKEIFNGLRIYLYQELLDFLDKEQIEELLSNLKTLKYNGFENSLKQIKPISRNKTFKSKRTPNKELEKGDLYTLIYNIQYYLPLSLTRQCTIYMKMFPELLPLSSPKVMQEGVSRQANSPIRKNISIEHIPFNSNKDFENKMLEFSRKTNVDTSTAI